MIYMMSKQLPVCFPLHFLGVGGGRGGGSENGIEIGVFFPKRARCLGYGPRPATKKEKKKKKSNIFAVGGRFKQIMIIYLPLFFFYIVLK